MNSQLGRVVSFFSRTADVAWAPCAAAIGRTFRRDHILRVVKGHGPQPVSTAAVFCHFDRGGEVAPHTKRYIEALGAQNLPLVIVSNAPNLSDAAVHWLLPRSFMIVVRRNVGHDFGAWRDGMRISGLPFTGMERLILANDSVYGPFGTLDRLFERLDPSGADVWGLTESWQYRYHLQSYFLAFGREALRCKGFQEFWDDLPDVLSRHWVIQNCEIGLTQRFIRSGLVCRAVWPYCELIDWVRSQSPIIMSGDASTASPLDIVRDMGRLRVLVGATHRVPMNPTADMWRPLLELGFPFIKRDLITRNQTCVPDVVLWREVASRISVTDTNFALDDLRRKLRKCAP